MAEGDEGRDGSAEEPSKKRSTSKKAAAPAKKAANAAKNATSTPAAVTPAAPSLSAPPSVEQDLWVPDVDSDSWWRVTKASARRLVSGLRSNWHRTLLCAVIGWGIGWLANLWVMARKYDGFRVPSGSAATGDGNLVRGASYWFVVSMIVSAIINYRINVGSARFWSEVRGFPSTIRRMVSDDGSSAAAHLLYGFAGGTLITFTLGPSLSGAFAVVVLVAVATLLRPLLVGGLMLAWRWVVGRLAPQSPNRTPVQAVTVATLGSAAAKTFAALVVDSTAKLVFGVGAVVAAWMMTQRAKPSVATGLMLIAGGVTLLVVAGAQSALADDGGWRECGASLANWWGCTGSDRVRWLAAFGATGSGFGAGLGSALLPPTDGGPPKPWSEMTDEERNRFRQDYIRRYKATHPNATGEQTRRFIEGLDAQPPGFWEKQWNGLKDFWNAYSEDVTSGKQAEGLGGMFYGMYEGFSDAASATWNELSQLDDTLAAFPDVFWKDLSSGEQRERLKGMLDWGGNALNKANEILNMSPDDLAAAYDKYGKENVQKFMQKMGEFERSLANSDPTEIRRKIGQLAGAAEFEALLGAGTDKGMALSKEGLAFLREAKLTQHMDEAVTGLRGTAKGVKVPKLSDDLLFERDNLLKMAKNGPVKITPEEADRLLGLDEKILLERQATILQYGEGKAKKGAFTQYKLGDENSIMAKQLRTEHPDIWTGKWNPVGDKSYVPGEEAFMSADDLARFKDTPPLPGETVNYKPRQLSASEYDSLPPELQSRYNDRMKDATAWDGHTGFDSRKAVDYSDPKVRAKYGEMYVPEDPGSPVAKAEFWKDPTDNRVYVRYQTKDGTWSAPRRQASDIDTVTHSGGQKLTYEQSRDLQYKQSMGQIGEGDTPAWARSMLEKSPDGYTLKDPNMRDSLYKAIDALHKADGQPVVEQTLDGLVLKSAQYPELEMAKDAAMKLDAKGAWTPEQRAALVGKGILSR